MEIGTNENMEPLVEKCLNFKWKHGTPCWTMLKFQTSDNRTLDQVCVCGRGVKRCLLTAGSCATQRSYTHEVRLLLYTDITRPCKTGLTHSYLTLSENLFRLMLAFLKWDIFLIVRWNSSDDWYSKFMAWYSLYNNKGNRQRNQDKGTRQISS